MREHTFVPPRYSEHEARAAIAASSSWTEALRQLGMRSAGGNHRTLRTYAEEIWHISADHFDPGAASRAALERRSEPTPLVQVLVRGSTYSRAGEPADRLPELRRDVGHALRHNAVRKWLWA